MMLANPYVCFRGRDDDGRVEGAARDDVLKTVPNMGVDLLCTTRSTIEVAHFRYFVSERRGSLSPNRRNADLDFET